MCFYLSHLLDVLCWPISLATSHQDSQSNDTPKPSTGPKLATQEAHNLAPEESTQTKRSSTWWRWSRTITTGQSDAHLDSTNKLDKHQKTTRPHHYASNLIENFGPSDDLIEAKKSKVINIDDGKMSIRESANNNNNINIGTTNNSDNPAAPTAKCLQNKQLDCLDGEEDDSHRLANKIVIVGGGTQTPEDEANRFRIRTSNRRHLDFDDEFDLGDVNAKARSRWTGPFHFIQAADSQFGMIDSYVHKRIEPGWREEIELCESLVHICNQMEPRPLFMIICGDLVDSFPASEVGRKQVIDFKRIFAKLDPKIPLVCVCGNHDVGNEPTRETVLDYRKAFGDDYFYFTRNDVLFIVINSQFYQHREYIQDIAREQDEWLESILEKCKLFKYSIVFEHIPWFLNDAQEEDDYFNIRKEVRLKWLLKFKQAGITKIMCGHYHRNAGGWFDGMELIVTSAIGAQCGNDKSGVRIVRVLDGSIEHQYYAMADIPRRVEL